MADECEIDVETSRKVFFDGTMDRLDQLGVPIEVASSWHRVRSRGGLTDRIEAKTSASLLRDEALSSTAALVSDIQAMASFLGTSRQGVAVVLCDRNGRVVQFVPSPLLSDALVDAGFRSGAIMLERSAGTNAIDVAIRTRGVAATIGEQHTCVGLDSFWLTGVAIIGAHDELRGAIGLLGLGSVLPPGASDFTQAAGRLVLAHLATFDLTEQLGQLLAQQRAIVDNISDGLIVLNRDGVVTHLNAHAGRILNLNPEASIGQGFAELLDFEPIIGPIFETGKGYRDEELVIKTARRQLHLIDTAIPIKNAAGQVTSIVNTFREFGEIRRVAQKLGGNDAVYHFEDIVGDAPSLISAIESARKTARGQASILLLGESGVGKELFAHAIHRESERRSGPFIAINCAALPRDLIESELFGYVGGSFTGANKSGRPGKFELASGGTIFLDEISEMPLDVQVKLLRVLQEREVVRVGGDHRIPVDIRVVSASNRHLRPMVRDGGFRQDLFYRINVIEIIVPALRERRGDISRLAHLYLRRYAKQLGKSAFDFMPETMADLVSYDWPGNVRELQNTIERLVNLSDGEIVGGAVRPEGLSNPDAAPAHEAMLENAGDELTIESHERRLVAQAIARFSGNVTRAAEALGISKPTLYRKVREYGLKLNRKTE